jgi:hypothetical protein
VTFVVVPISLMLNAGCPTREDRTAGVASTDMADEYHQAGQEAAGGGERDERFEEQSHGASPKEALGKPTAAGSTAKFVAPFLPDLCFGMIARDWVECFRRRVVAIGTATRLAATIWPLTEASQVGPSSSNVAEQHCQYRQHGRGREADHESG